MVPSGKNDSKGMGPSPDFNGLKKENKNKMYLLFCPTKILGIVMKTK